MKGRAGLFVVLVAMMVAFAAPGVAHAGGGNCGAPAVQYLGAYSQTRCGPYGAFTGAIAYSSDSAGNVTGSNVCVDVEYPGSLTPYTGWSCSNSTAGVSWPYGGSWVAGYLNNYGGAHYLIAQYYWA
jgi:hypothetical protein